MSKDSALLQYVLRLGDNALITGQRMIERVAAEPELEEELANANFALDYIGQARLFYSYAAEIEGAGRDEDFYAYRRDSQAFRNFLLVEQANGHFGDSIVRQVLFETFYLKQLQALMECDDARLAEIAARAEKEIRYHLRHSSQWLVRLGDGTEVSHERVQKSLLNYWRFTGDLFAGDAVDQFLCEELGGPDLVTIEASWKADISALLTLATLTRPDDEFMMRGGRDGMHSEEFSFLIAEMQHLQRAHPGATW